MNNLLITHNHMQANLNSLFYFLGVKSSKFLGPAVQDRYVLVDKINFIF